jgi:predicted GNAT superfamily acetyltransferase
VAEESRGVSAIHDLGPLDSAHVLRLNNAHAKETSELDEERLEALLGGAFYARGVNGGETAFLIALDHNSAYENPNFEWFTARRETFVYIDRVIVAQAARGRGIARLLYEDLFATAKLAGHDRVVCEVNIEPPNPASDAFHSAMGFVADGEAAIHNGTKIVRYFEKALGDALFPSR